MAKCECGKCGKDLTGLTCITNLKTLISYCFGCYDNGTGEVADGLTEAETDGLKWAMTRGDYVQFVNRLLLYHVAEAVKEKDKEILTLKNENVSLTMKLKEANQSIKNMQVYIDKLKAERETAELTAQLREAQKALKESQDRGMEWHEKADKLTAQLLTAERELWEKMVVNAGCSFLKLGAEIPCSHKNGTNKYCLFETCPLRCKK